MSPKTSKQFALERQASEEKILDAGLQLFGSKGFYNTSVRDIAKAAGISVGLIYNYFKSKEELLKVLLSRAFSNMDKSFNIGEMSSPKKQLLSLIDGYLELVNENKSKVRMLALMGIQQDKFDFVEELTHGKFQTNVSVIESLLNKLQIKNSKSEALLIAATLDGLMFQSLLMGEKIEFESVRSLLIEKYQLNEI